MGVSAAPSKFSKVPVMLVPEIVLATVYTPKFISSCRVVVADGVLTASNVTLDIPADKRLSCVTKVKFDTLTPPLPSPAGTGNSISAGISISPAVFNSAPALIVVADFTFAAGAGAVLVKLLAPDGNDGNDIFSIFAGVFSIVEPCLIKDVELGVIIPDIFPVIIV